MARKRTTRQGRKHKGRRKQKEIRANRPNWRRVDGKWVKVKNPGTHKKSNQSHQTTEGCVDAKALTPSSFQPSGDNLNSEKSK